MTSSRGLIFRGFTEFSIEERHQKLYKTQQKIFFRSRKYIYLYYKYYI